MSLDPSIIAARAEVERTRTRLIETAQELQQRINPKTLAQNVWHDAKEKGADLAEDAVDAVRNRPVAVGGVAAALALFLARGPLLDLAKKAFGDSPGGSNGDRRGKSRGKGAVHSEGRAPGRKSKSVQTEGVA